MNELLDKQTSEGLWSAGDLSIIQKFKNLFGVTSLNEDKLRDEIKKLSSKSIADAISVTICALFILEEYYEAKEDEWQMIAKKAKTALKIHGITKLDGYFQIIQQKAWRSIIILICTCIFMIN